MAYYAATSSSIGMQLLATVDQLIVAQRDTYFSNSYVVVTDCGELLFSVEEHPSGVNSFLSGHNREFTMEISDTHKKRLMTLRRPFKWFGGSKVEVTFCGSVISVIRQIPTSFDKLLTVNDAADRPVLRLKKPWGSSEFELQAMTKQRVGGITKQWDGLMQEMFSSSDDFLITFPQDLEVCYKAALIGACVLIDFLYYER